MNPVFWDTRVLPERSKTTLKPKSPLTKGNRRWAPRIAEIAYDPVVPMKLENRRAPARGGHGIQRREGANRWTKRHSDTFPRLRA